MNIALGKPTFQHSTYNLGQADHAVDGDKNTVYTGQSCTETQWGSNVWWAVDLQQTTSVDAVEITNRGDCCGKSLGNCYDIE